MAENGRFSAGIVRIAIKRSMNRGKFMTVIDSYRDTEGAKDLINRSVDQYRAVYKAMGST